MPSNPLPPLSPQTRQTNLNLPPPIHQSCLVKILGAPAISQHSLQPRGDQAVLPRRGPGLGPGAHVAVRRHRGQHRRPGADGVVRLDQGPAHLGQDHGRVRVGGAVANLPHAVSGGGAGGGGEGGGGG